MATKTFLLIYITFFSIILSSCATVNKDAAHAALYLQIGNDYLEQKNYPEALTNLLKANELEPNNAVIMNSLGLLYFAQEKYDIAKKYLQRAVKKEPKYSDARNNLGRIYIAQGKYDKAIAEIKTTLKDLTYTHPERAHTNLGLVYFRKDNFSAAKERLAEAIRLNKNYCPAYGYYGQTLMKLKQYESAGGVFDRAIKVCQNEPEEVHFLSGLSYYLMGKKKKAIIRLKEVSQMYPSSKFAEKSRSLLKVIGQDKI